MPRDYSCLKCTYEYTQWMGQRCPSDNDYSHYSKQHYYILPCENWIWCYKFHYSTHHVYVCITCPRNGPNLRDLRELLGQWRELPMLPVVSTMERSTPSCWLLGDGIRMTTLCRMHGSWMSTLGGGGRWVVMNVWLVQLTESAVQTRSISFKLCCCKTTKVTNHRILDVCTNFQNDVRISWTSTNLAEASRQCYAMLL